MAQDNREWVEFAKSGMIMAAVKSGMTMFALNGPRTALSQIPIVCGKFMQNQAGPNATKPRLIRMGEAFNIISGKRFDLLMIALPRTFYQTASHGLKGDYAAAKNVLIENGIWNLHKGLVPAMATQMTKGFFKAPIVGWTQYYNDSILKSFLPEGFNELSAPFSYGLLKAILSGLLVATAETAILNPGERISTSLATAQGNDSKKNILQEFMFKKAQVKDGQNIQPEFSFQKRMMYNARILYAGSVPAFSKTFVAYMCTFGLLGPIQKATYRWMEVDPQKPTKPAMLTAALTTSIFTALVCAPLDAAKTSKQGVKGDVNAKPMGMIEILRFLYNTHGWRGPMHGCSPKVIMMALDKTALIFLALILKQHMDKNDNQNSRETAQDEKSNDDETAIRSLTRN